MPEKVGFEKLDLYHLSFSFVLEVYKVLKRSLEFDSNLASQLKRSAASMPLNLAEGSAALTKKDYLYHVNYGYKSASEVKVTINLCNALGFMNDIDTTTLLNKLEEIKKRFYGLRAALMDNSDFKIGDRFKFYLGIEEESKIANSVKE